MTVRHEGPAPTVRLVGEHDLSTAGQIRAQVLSELAVAHAVVVDLWDVSFLDASVLRVFVEAHQAAERLGGLLQMVLPDRPDHHRVLFSSLAELGHSLHISTSLEEAYREVERWAATRALRPEPLPSPPDTGPYRREDFLLALVTYLARLVQLRDGRASEEMVARVGSEVGERMEQAYRVERGIEGPLTSEQMAELMVALKGAIGGEFSAEEVSADRIVLINQRCPFGESVMAAPSLCGMTRSVFGGIAQRNAGGGEVRLEERIAVGDPGCRIEVLLGDPAHQPEGTSG